MARLILCGVLSVAALAAQDAAPSLTESLENLQNHLSGATARGHLSYSDRQEILGIDAQLGRVIGEKRLPARPEQSRSKSAASADRPPGAAQSVSARRPLAPARRCGRRGLSSSHEYDVLRGYRGMRNF